MTQPFRPETTFGTSLTPLPILPIETRKLPDEHGLGLYQRFPVILMGPGYVQHERCQWDGALLKFACFAHGDWDSPEPEWLSRCPMCDWEETW